MFELRLCLALGKTLSELRREPLEFIALWRAYELLQGFPQQRQEASIALSGAAICQTFGGKVKAKDLLPNFGEVKKLSYKQGSELFEAFALAHNERIKAHGQ